MTKKKSLVILSSLLLLGILFAAVRTAPMVLRNRCVGCESCVNTCPVNAIQMEDGRAIIDQETCINCLMCIKACTYQAIRTPK